MPYKSGFPTLIKLLVVSSQLVIDFQMKTKDSHLSVKEPLNYLFKVFVERRYAFARSI